MAQRWLRGLMRTIGGCWEWHAPALRINFRYREPEDGDDFWEVWAYPSVQEIYGGKHDGKTGWCGFQLDVSRLLGKFGGEQITVSTGLEDDPPELVLEGSFRGHPVLLHVWLGPPEDEEPSEVIDLTDPSGAGIREKRSG
jgi:hypothetical protein